MTRVRATAAVALALSAGVVHGDDNWKATKPAGPTAPPVVPVIPDVPGNPTWTAPKADGPVWGPAKGAEPVAAPPPQEPAPPPKPTAKPADPAPLPAPRTLPAQPTPAATPPAPAADQASKAIWGGGRFWPDNAVLLEPMPKASPVGGVPPPIRHGTFGSPNVTLSRDYHVLDLVGAGLLADDGGTVVPNEGPPTSNFFVEAEYLLWWVRRGNIPALATTAPDTTNPAGNFGFLGRPGTSVLLPAGPFGDGQRSGFRIRAGGWFDDWWSGCGLDGSFFFLGRKTDTFAVSSAQTPVITRPFFVPNLGANGQPIGEFGEVVAGGGTAGALAVTLDSRLWGADVNVKSCICRTCESHSEWFVGYRHLNLKEDLSITESITSGPLDQPTFPLGTRIVVNDTFAVQNQFHGGQVGYATGRRWGRLDADLRASVALGVTHQELDITGSQLVQPPGQATPSAFTGGLVAAGPNLGHFTQNKFSVAPEVTMNLGYLVTPNLRVSVGYNFLYWTNVLRPGEQIDRVVDPTFVPNFNLAVPPSGQNRPQPLFNQSDLWVQGIQFGVQYRW